MDREIVEQNDASRERLKALVGGLTEEEFGRPLGDGWTVAAALAHLAFWDRRVAVLVDRWQRDGVAPSSADADAINDAMLPQWLAIPPREAARLALAAAEEADSRLATLSAAQLAAIRAAGNHINVARAVHRGKHLDEIERALESAAS